MPILHRGVRLWPADMAMEEVFGSKYVSLHVRVSNKAALHLYKTTLGYKCATLFCILCLGICFWGCSLCGCPCGTVLNQPLLTEAPGDAGSMTGKPSTMQMTRMPSTCARTSIPADHPTTSSKRWP